MGEQNEKRITTVKLQNTLHYTQCDLKKIINQ